MRCKDAERWISLRVDGEETPPETRAALDEHLAACGSCRELLETETARSLMLMGALGGEKRERGCEELAAAIVRSASLPLRAAPAPRRIPGRPLALSLAASLLIAAGSLWLLVPPAASRPGELLLERSLLDTDVVATPEGSLGRDVSTDVWTYELEPAKDGNDDRGGRGGRPWSLEVERVDTRYFRLATWPYR